MPDASNIKLFGPGVIDGSTGANFTRALRGYQEARGIAVTGQLDAATVKSFAAFRAMPTVIDVKLDEQILEGPFVGPIPDKEADQAKMKSLGYSDAMENSGITWDQDKIKTYLAGPPMMVPGGKMAFVGPTDPDDVNNVIAYLTSLK